jgi:membrane protein YqaA with SNARE-associated domain
MNYNSKANFGLYRQRIADYRGRMNQILLYIISFAVSGIFKLKPDLLLHEMVLSKTLFNLKILDRFFLCTSSLGNK